ncbi:MAG: M23 family metallopeptidase [Treponema sp.]|nr:M23 family metallopeptidase [Treponema sp.]
MGGKRIPWLTLAESAVITAGACSLVLLVSVIVLRSRPVQDGKGGLETPGIPIVTEETLPVETVSAPEYELSYTSYRVRPGDMIGIIADQKGVTQDTIISVNNIRSSRLLQIGMFLKIPSMPGILYTVRKDNETITSIAQKYEVDAAKCAAVNHKDCEESLEAGMTLFVPDAALDWVTRQEINGDLFHKPIRARWYLSSRFGWRKSPFTGVRSYHSGVDMACPQGTAIYAALPGTVTATGYNNTYGNYVIITHHSGYKTLYGHMSAILAVKGQRVSTDTKIGKVGSTGLSTGPHLHFTVFKNGKQVNPQNLWG